ncbi:MAG: hypothetical protein AAF432_07800, partial [Planctomycetota bacterium]
LCGLLSGNKIRPRFVLFGALGMAIFFGLLGSVTPSYVNVVVFVCGAGFSAGFYVIPLIALIQHLSPEDKLGQFLGATGGLNWSFIAIGSVTFWVGVGAFGIPPTRLFLLCSLLSVIGTVTAASHLRRHPHDPAVS